MKLSEMSTENLAATLCKIAAPVERIGADQEVNDVLKELSSHGGKISVLQAGTATFGKLIPVLLDRHKEDTYAILSALTGKSVGKLREQRGLETIRDVKNCIDGDLIAFFKSST